MSKEIIKRLEDELSDLSGKISRLISALDYVRDGSATIPEAQVQMLKIQKMAMLTYRQCLVERIDHLKTVKI